MVKNLGELGTSMQKIVQRLMANDTLVKLLYYTDKDPLSHDALTDTEKKTYIYNKLIRVLPRFDPNNIGHSQIGMRVVRGQIGAAANEYNDITFAFTIVVPLDQWAIVSTQLRMFAILQEIITSLRDKDINGLGVLTGGNFDIDFTTDEVCGYEMTFHLTEFA